MSINAIEKALWQMSGNPAEAERFRRNTQAYLKDFKLDEGERSMVTSWDVGTLASRGVNPLLLMMAFTAVKGMGGMVEYVTKINQPSGAGPAE